MSAIYCQDFVIVAIKPNNLFEKTPLCLCEERKDKAIYKYTEGLLNPKNAIGK